MASRSMKSNAPDPLNEALPFSDEIEIMQTPLASMDGVNNGVASSDSELSKSPAVTAWTFTTFGSNYNVSKARLNGTSEFNWIA